MVLELVDTLSQLVAIPSVNPMGRPLSGPEFFETRMTEHLQGLFEGLGVPWQRQQIEPGRDNIIARLDGTVSPADGGQVLLWEAHQDTVPVDGMTIEPWTPVVRDGKLYGRGSCDIKGGMTAMLCAFSRLVQELPEPRPTIMMACTVNEEHGYSGATELCELWKPGADSLFPAAPTAAVIAEPTDLQVVVAHKGALRWNCHTHGRAGHSSQPHLGKNAIYMMAHVVSAFEAYARDVLPKIPEHRLCGAATISVGTISGGISVNTIPDLCTIEIDRRLLPGEDSRDAHRQILDFVASYPGVTDVDHEEPWMWGSTLGDEHNTDLGKRLAEVARPVVGSCEMIGVPYGTNASRIAAAGVPSVVFGPGSISQAHTADEWLSIDELTKASEVLYQLGKTGL